MKRYKLIKTISLVMSLTIMITAFSGCAYFFRIGLPQKNEVVFEYPSTLDEKLKYDLNDGDMAELDKLFQDLDSAVGSDSGTDKIRDLVDEIGKGLDHLESQASISYINYCKYGNNEEYYSQYEKANSAYGETLTKLYAAYKKIYDSRYSDEFYEKWSDDEIDMMLDYARYHTAEYNELSNQYDAIVEDARGLDEKAEDYFDRAEEIFKKAVIINNKKADCFGFDNYMDFAYDYEYSRDYSPKDTEKLCDYTGKYLMPVLREIFDCNEDSIKNLNDSAVNEAYEFLVGDFRTESMQELIENYTRSTNRTMYGCFMENKLDAKYYVMSDDDGLGSHSSAFTVYIPDIYSAVMYFGEGYHDPMTFIHEFGHFSAGQPNSRVNPSMDVCETQSQGNEFMFLAYLKDKMSYDGAYELLMGLRLEQALISIVQCLIVNDFEMSVYSMTESELAAASLDEVYKRSCEKIADYDELAELFGYDPAVYWRYVTVEAPAYYISYAVSLLPCIELFVTAMEDYDEAADIYSRILCCVTPYFESELEYAGLDAPFDERIFKIISDSIADIIGGESLDNAA